MVTIVSAFMPQGELILLLGPRPSSPLIFEKLQASRRLRPSASMSEHVSSTLGITSHHILSGLA